MTVIQPVSKRYNEGFQSLFAVTSGTFKSALSPSSHSFMSGWRDAPSPYTEGRNDWPRQAGAWKRPRQGPAEIIVRTAMVAR